MQYSHRRFEPGDEDAINALYLQVTKRHRTASAFRWQWLEAPEGPGEIWLIEAHDESGRPRLIGHHGVMPIAFSRGADTFLAGKTENTMVLPEFRRKILYPRFEQRFFEQYENRFDLLFSTTGPRSALRQRTRLGYSADRQWIRVLWSLHPMGRLARVAHVVTGIGKRSHSQPVQLAGSAFMGFSRLGGGLKGGRRSGRSTTLALGDRAAVEHRFFENYWNEVRHEYPLTPRRYREDLAWRFWENPNVNYSTLVVDNDEIRGYAIVRRASSVVFELEDVNCSPRTREALSSMLNIVAEWAVAQGAGVLGFLATDDASGPAEAVLHAGYSEISNAWPERRFGTTGTDATAMLRKITDRGAESGLAVNDWFITRMVFEGRDA